MSPEHWRLAQSQRLLVVGFALVFVAMVVGLLVPAFAVPKRAVSAHVLGVAQGTLLAVTSMTWKRLALGKRWANVAALALIYGCIAAWLANVAAAVWPSGGATFPTVDARGTWLHEIAIAIALRTSAVALLAGMMFVLVGLRRSVPSD
jgi:hydroxylaminobenzene mutase